MTRLLSRCAWLLAAVALLVGAPLDAQDDPAAFIPRLEGPQSPNRQGIDSLTIQQLMERFRVPDVSIAVIKDFKIHWAKAYGLADVESGRAADVTTLFQAASISKPATAMATLRRAQEGTLSIDVDINTLLKSWKVPASDLTRDQSVTARSLLSHTSGADDSFGFPGYDPSVPRPTLVQTLDGEKTSNVGSVRFGRRVYSGQKYSGGGKVLSQASAKEMLAPTGLGPFAVGLSIDKRSERTITQARQLNREIATPEQTRALLGLPGRDS